ncbi:SDR family NAD(P)-dependent oxidoreductase [Sphingomonas jatrophae]|uniref:Gluconate 5-dehydrogenase/2-deoxy-D-gluconate 3-dehydrogenase n=1 Tax=Sphingomonas jatrophae TaxID=1166337 RepID=A0A1I6M4V8_9SPHN|nr:SDR family oxidoreductase [Sphingomonas jatrophae]SFS10755.1 gluconate 5-dehydrogenase/2-deoxy-D-gluconate 3-dehydrogenase [Sphingomonas jatrophae]
MSTGIARFALDGQVAIVTGGGGGLGSAGATALAEAGADVALVARNRIKLEDAARAVEAAGRRALIVEADVADAEAMVAAVEAVEHAFGRVDILFNNAGITDPQTVLDIAPEQFLRILEVNVAGAFHAIRAVARPMIARGYGRIVNMGSILSGRGMANRAAYCASKAGLANLGAACAFEFGAHGITVNTLGATVIVTDLNRELVRTQPALYAKVVERTPLGRLGEIEDLMGALLFLASPAARFVTGQTLFVDGGYTAG